MKLFSKTLVTMVIIITVLAMNWDYIDEIIDTSVTGNAVVVQKEFTTPPEVYFCPRDGCAAELIAWIDAAEEYVHCALFDVGLEEIRDKLVERSTEIEVKLVTDNNYFEKVSYLDFAKHDNRSSLMHNKFCVLDGKAVWTGSFNPTKRGNEKNNNNAVLYQSRLLASTYEDEFEEMWNGVFGKGSLSTETEFEINGKTVEVYFCPEDWCANKVIYALQDAETSIDFMTFSFTHDAIGEQLITMANKGVLVRGVFEKSQNNAYTEKPKLADAGIDVKWDGNGANMHHKVFIVDNKTVVTGSFNPSKNGDEKNDENLVIIHDSDVAEKFVEEFEMVWAGGALE
ncbi:hypothetical protein HQ545_01950 [Candidatus Woesearchaeota archaeon]|nr:hypothetical protein [Candidatus Woesearchaeota archaeon]